MGFFDTLFHRSKGNDTPKFLTKTAFLQNLAKQKKMAPMTVAQLRKHGVAESRSLKLEFFFYSDMEANAQSLVTALQELKYEAHSQRAAGNSGQFVITGWSNPIKMGEAEVVSWTEEMCRLGFEHDAEFDGWGTNPN